MMMTSASLGTSCSSSVTGLASRRPVGQTAGGAVGGLHSSFMSGSSLLAGPVGFAAPAPLRRGRREVAVSGLDDIRKRISSVKNTRKITDAMKLVAAAKVRRAQEAVLNGRPFSEKLVKVMFGLQDRLKTEDAESPLANVRPVKKVCLMVVTGSRGLCGGYNNFIIKKAEQRMKELEAQGVQYTVVCVGQKGITYWNRRPGVPRSKSFVLPATPTIAEATQIADELFSLFVSEEVDKVEMVYTRFVSLISSRPIVQTLLPLSPKGELCDVNGNCVDALDDEVFKLTTVDGQLGVEVESRPTEAEDLSALMSFEQDPGQILDALLPLYMNSTVLRSMQESTASELAARMTAMGNASDNAKDLTKSLTIFYNKARQAKITQEILEICAGSSAV